MTEPVLRTEDLTMRFGGLVAVNNVSLAVDPRQIHAIIGPNGAGKSTVVNMLSGHLIPSEGRVLFKEQDITGLPANRVSRIGIGRSFQRTNIFPSFTCLDNCWLAAQSRLGHSFRFFRRAERYRQVEELAWKGLTMAGLEHQAGTRASAMSHGEQRQLEIGMVLATDPEFLVLDEPMAGMGSEESHRVVELLRQLGERYPLVLVEHDMDAVFSIAHRLTVMVNGEVLASGTVETVRNDPAVQEAYLGEGEEVH